MYYRNDILEWFLPSKIFYFENTLYLRNPIQKIPFTSFIPESFKIIMVNYGITKNIGVQEEKCRGAERNTLHANVI